ncbi:NUDIX domain-containing protein [Pedobacter sp. PF22-3]|uniref:NUDIX hydrolase n=1 Tax=Pedobacter sp. PF22-3 TaxID=2994467 RepID=UPI00224763AB|nr:NUDIX domain-containing protein [Pedobacter sp. PF22-3]MCX2493269.1 NUDIX domain-containing protein [Pedobacter sp. PF22-3]
MIDQNIKIAVDAIVFGYEKGTLYVLAVQQRFGKLADRWVLPGGFILDDEPLITAVERELKEEAGITVNYLEQLGTFGDDVKRDERFRVISVAYFALVNPKNFVLKADTDAKDAKWFPVAQVPALGYDHNEMVKLAHQRLKSKLTYQPIGFDLLDHEFLFSDLENLYCSILERDIDRRNFRKKILSFGIVKETDKVVKIGASGRPGKLFVFDKPKYHQLLKENFQFDIRFA